MKCVKSGENVRYFHIVTGINCVCGCNSGRFRVQWTCGNTAQLKLRRFAEILCLDFVAIFCNTSGIAAKPRLVSTQNLLANRSCSIMRYCLTFAARKGGRTHLHPVCRLAGPPSREGWLISNPIYSERSVNLCSIRIVLPSVPVRH